MINLDKSENWSSWEDWVKTKQVYYGSKTCLQVYGGNIKQSLNRFSVFWIFLLFTNQIIINRIVFKNDGNNLLILVIPTEADDIIAYK